MDLSLRSSHVALLTLTSFLAPRFARRYCTLLSQIVVDSNPPSIRYFLIQPHAAFDDLVTQPAALLLAGGTMRPFEHVAAELFPSLPSAVATAASADGKPYSDPVTRSGDLTFFSCDHVVPASHVRVQAVRRGPSTATIPSGPLLDFRHAGRNLDATIDGLGEVVLRGLRGCGAGVVVFLTSYKYEEVVFRRWRATGALEKMKAAKQVHREPR